MRVILVLGAPGSGKSTQAKFIAQKLNLPHLSTGRLCRKIALGKSEFGKKVNKIIDSGQILPDEMILKILKKEIKKEEYKKGFVMEGTPRNLNQAKLLDLDIDKVFYLEVSDKVARERLLKRSKVEKRDDDAPEVIKDRLKFFHKEIDPIADYYEELGLLIRVDGEPSINQIRENISKYL